MTKRRLPVQQLVILALCRFAEPIALTSVFPYLPEMIESLNVPKNKVAKWAGITSAVFSLCQCLTGIPWGRASDRFGRKPVILLGLTNTMVTSLIWGFSTSVPMAIVVRALAGAGNGNIGIIRTMVAELVPYKELQPRAFSLMPLVWSIGSIFGPAIGGALANPLHVPPGREQRHGLLEKFPYALPNIIVSCVFFCGITIGILFLQETLETKKGRWDYGLMAGEKLVAFAKQQLFDARRIWQCGSSKEVEPLLGSHSHTTDPLVDEEYASPRKTSASDKAAPGWAEVITRQSTLNLLVYSILALHSLGYDQLLPIFLHHPRQDTNSPEIQLPFKFAGGFGLDSRQIGMLFVVYGVSGMLAQFLVFPPVARRFGVLNCLRACSLVFPVLYFVTPYTSLLPSHLLRQFAIYAILILKGWGCVFAFPCSTIMLTNSASSLRILGTLNGIATSVSAVGRAAGPAVGGATFSLGVERGYVIAPWWIFAAISLSGALPVYFLVEGEGFGADSDTETLSESGSISDSVDTKSGSGIGSINPATSTTPFGPGPPLRRLSASNAAGPAHYTRSSRSVSYSEAIESESDEDDNDVNKSLDRSKSSTAWLDGSRSRSGSAPQRYESTVPIGMGVGISRRLSSNLGQSFTGWDGSGSRGG